MEITVVATDIDIQKSDIGGGSVLGAVDGIPTVELFKESSEGVRFMGPEKEYVIDKPSTIGWVYRAGSQGKSSSRWPMNKLT